MSYETLDVTRDGRGVVTVRLNLPETHNALSARMMDDLTALAGVLGADDSRVVVLTGNGRSFCAGGDLRWMRAQFDAAPEARAVEARRLAGMLQALNTMPKPLIARVNGAAFGGGVGLCCVADVAVGADTVMFGSDGDAAGPDPGDHRTLCDRADGRGTGAAGVHVVAAVRRG